MGLPLVGAAAALLALAAATVDVGTTWYAARALEEGAAGVPSLESAGWPAMAALYAGRALAFGLSVFGVAALGYWTVSRSRLASSYRSLASQLAVGGGTGYLLAVGLLAVVGGGALRPLEATSSLSVLAVTLAAGLQFAIVGTAGAAIGAGLADTE